MQQFNNINDQLNGNFRPLYSPLSQWDARNHCIHLFHLIADKFEVPKKVSKITFKVITVLNNAKFSSLATSSFYLFPWFEEKPHIHCALPQTLPQSTFVETGKTSQLVHLQSMLLWDRHLCLSSIPNESPDQKINVKCFSQECNNVMLNMGIKLVTLRLLTQQFNYLSYTTTKSIWINN